MWSSSFLLGTPPRESACDNCTCNAGWTSVSDFMNASSAGACQVNTRAIQVLWSLCLVWGVANFAVLLPCKARELLSSHFEQKDMLLRTRNKGYSLHHNPNMIGLGLIYFVYLPAYFALALGKIISGEEEKIGASPLATVAFIVANLTFGTSSLGAFRAARLRQCLRLFGGEVIPNYANVLARFEFQCRVLAVVYCTATTVYILPMWITNAELMASRIGLALCLAQLCICFALLAWQAGALRALLRVHFSQAATRLEAEPAPEEAGEENGRKAALLLVRDETLYSQALTFGASAGVALGLFIVLCAPPLWLLIEYFLPMAFAAQLLCLYLFISALHERRFKRAAARLLRGKPPQTQQRLQRKSTAPLSNEDDGVRVVHDPEDPLFLNTGREEWQALGFVRSLASALQLRRSFGASETRQVVTVVGNAQ